MRARLRLTLSSSNSAFARLFAADGEPRLYTLEANGFTRPMILNKHRKLFRKLLGSIVRPKSGAKNQLTRAAKCLYLFVSWIVEMCGDLIFLAKKRNGPAISDPRRILIVKDDQLGDVMFSTLLLPAIKQKYPEVKIDYLVRPQAAQILKNNPSVSEIYHWNNILLEFLPGRGDRRGFWAKIAENQITSRTLRQNYYDLVINARAFPPSANLFRKRWSKKLVTFDIAEQSFVADYWAEYDLEAEDWSNYANLLAPLGIEPSSVSYAVEFYNLDASNPMQEIRPYVVISPVSFEKDRQWTTDNWTALIAALLSQGMNVALTGMPLHKNYLQDIVPAGTGAEADVHLFTNMRLPELGALVNGAAIFIGIDSFPAHLALALRKRVALLINPEVYYLKGYSRQRFASEARSMLPIVPNAAFFDLETTTAEQVAAYCLNPLIALTAHGT